MTHAEADIALIRRVSLRDARACQQLIQRLTPVVRHRVAQVLSGHCKRTNRDVNRQDLLDLIQEIFMILLEREARVLTTWAPELGLSLENFVGLIAHRETISILRSGRRSAWAETPTSEDVLQREVDPITPECRVASKEQLELVLDAARGQLSPRGLLVFEALVTSSKSPEEICADFAMSPGALHTFQSRLRSLLRELRARFGSEIKADAGNATPRVPFAVRASRGEAVLARFSEPET